MKTITISNRGAGKTTRMVEWLKDNPTRILITFNNKEAERIRQQFNLEPQDANRVLGWQDYLDRKGMGKLRYANIGIDNADMILQNMVYDPIENISLSQD